MRAVIAAVLVVGAGLVACDGAAPAAKESVRDVGDRALLGLAAADAIARIERWAASTHASVHVVTDGGSDARAHTIDVFVSMTESAPSRVRLTIDDRGRVKHVGVSD